MMKKRLTVKENSPTCWQIPPLRATDHKYTRGSLVIFGGDAMTGAARLAARAAQRAGAGIVSIAATRASAPIYATALESVLVRACDTVQEWRHWAGDARVNALLIGPGAGLDERTRAALQEAATLKKPLVLDADALRLVAADASLRAALQPCPKILTPHAGECALLAEALALDHTTPRPALAATLATALNAVIVLKGSETLVVDGAHGTSTHPPAWLATAGTGDVLAGAIAALLAQGMPPLAAASAGVWLHAEAARLHGPGMIAEDVVASLPTILRGLTISRR